MENEKIICKADIRANKKIIKINFFLFGLSMLLAMVWMIPVKKGENDLWYYACNVLGIRIYNYSRVARSGWTLSYSAEWELLCFVIAIIFLVLLLFFNKSYLKNDKYCSIELNDKGVKGVRKSIFSKRDLNLPIEQIDSIMVSHSFWDTLFGGDTLVIRSASGLIKFPWVRNAKEFTDATLEKIDDFKQSAQEENKKLVASAIDHFGNNTGTQSNAQKIKDLKELLEIGAISQEEFDVKRKELLEKM